MNDTQAEKIFLLIDGSAIIHRAYHAMPSFTTAEGHPTGAIHGFFAMLLKLLQEIKPTYIAIAFDTAVPTFRQELFVAYHANRPEVESDLGDQFGIVREILSMGNIPVYEVEGFEADDVIGTIVKRVNDALSDTQVYIVTGDRDMMQLVNHKAKVLMPIKGISEVMLFDEARVLEKFGITPKEVIDYKALVGDPSDNYPGVAGIGPKTAANLIQNYKTLEDIYEHLGEIEAKNKNLGAKLAQGAEAAALAKKLATIVRDAPFVFSVKQCEIVNMSAEGFLEAFKKYELRTLSKRFSDFMNGVEADKKNQMKLL